MAYRSKEEQVSKKLREKILKRDNYTCQYCRKQFSVEDLEIDHIRPVCLGGDSRESNLVTSCWKCNQAKGTKRIFGMESEEDKKEFNERYRNKVISYGYYTNYIKKVYTSNGVSGVRMSRPQIDRYVKANIKNDSDFEVFKERLKEIGFKEMDREIIRFLMDDTRKKKEQRKLRAATKKAN